MRSRWSSFVVSALALAATAACGSDDVASTGSTSPATSGSTSPPTSEPTTPGTTTPGTTTPETTAPGTTAPGSTTPPETTPPETTEPTVPSTAGEVIRITTRPGFPLEPPYLGEGPDTVVYADGTAYTAFAGNFAAQPMVWPFNTGMLATGEVERLLQFAGERELLEEPEPLLPRTDIADATRFYISIRGADGLVVHSVEALDHPLPDEPEYLANLREFVGQVTAATDEIRFDTSGAFYEPTALAVLALPGEPRTGQVGPFEWPGAVSLADLSECTIVDDPATVDELVGELAGKIYIDGTETYRVAARVAFPGETTC